MRWVPLATRVLSAILGQPCSRVRCEPIAARTADTSRSHAHSVPWADAERSFGRVAASGTMQDRGDIRRLAAPFDAIGVGQ